MFGRFSLSSVIALLSCLSHLAFAGAVEDLYPQLRAQPVSYKVFGTVCEQVAKLEIMEQYDTKDYIVTSGILYANRTRTLGELDIVVLRRSDEEAILIGEVKCWRDLSGAQKKARSQLSRFTGTISSGTEISMHSDGQNGKTYDRDQFDEQPKIITISQQGGENFGFEHTIGIDLQEARELYQMLNRGRSQR
jgi:hypothetical protein